LQQFYLNSPIGKLKNIFVCCVSVDKDQREVIVELENIQKTYLLEIEGVPALRGVSTFSHF
jgi:hypothetical protein